MDRNHKTGLTGEQLKQIQRECRPLRINEQLEKTEAEYLIELPIDLEGAENVGH